MDSTVFFAMKPKGLQDINSSNYNYNSHNHRLNAKMNRRTNSALYFLFSFATLILLLPKDASGLSMQPVVYRNLVERRCFNETAYHEPFLRGQWNPVGSSVDYLIRLIEKIEMHISDPMTLLPLLLRRFRYDGTRQEGYRNFQSSTEIHRREVIERIFSNVPATQDFPENILFEDEKCALFFMMSHTVNETRPRTYTNPNNLFSGNEVLEDLDEKPYPRREVGTLSWANSDSLAISTTPVLLGLAVGLFRPRNFSMSDKLEAKIDPLLAVTFSDKLVLATIDSMKGWQNLALFGAQGRWNSSFCQTEFRLNYDYDYGANVTMAELNGAILGYNLGRKFLYEPDSTPLRKLKLSVILKRFFSRLGLSLNSGLCYQEVLEQSLQQRITENAVEYLLQWNKVYSYDSVELERLVSYVNYNQISYWSQILKSSSIISEECARIYNNLYGSSECETTSDIFIMLDNVPRYQQFQMEFIKRLLTRIQSHDYLGKVTILVNALHGLNSDIVGKLGADLRMPLHLLVYNTSSVQEATCRTAWYNYRESTISDKKLILEHLVTFFERHNITNPHPKVSRNFFWLNMRTNPYKIYSESGRMLMNQYRWYLKYFLNMRTFFISVNDIKSDDNDIIDILLNKDDRIQVSPSNLYDEQVPSRLSKRVCETPIPVIYQECDPTLLGQRSNWNNNQTSVITPHRKQYWAIYPKLFLNSPVVRLKFRAQNAKIRVCLNRFLRPEGDSSKCLDAKNDGDSVAFAVTMPCRWKRVDNCLPIYFTIMVANKAMITPENCVDDRCRGLEQVVWEMSHSGLECTTGYQLYKRQSSLSSASSLFTWSSRQYSAGQIIAGIIGGIIWLAVQHQNHF